MRAEIKITPCGEIASLRSLVCDEYRTPEPAVCRARAQHRFFEWRYRCLSQVLEAPNRWLNFALIDMRNQILTMNMISFRCAGELSIRLQPLAWREPKSLLVVPGADPDVRLGGDEKYESRQHFIQIYNETMYKDWWTL